VRSTIASSIASLAVLIVAFGASAAPINIGFESDTAPCGAPIPCNVPNDFESMDSSLVRFSDTGGVSDLGVFEFDGSIVLGVGGDDDDGLLINFDVVASALSLDFGNTSSALLGETAVLTVFLGGDEVDSISQALDVTTDAMSQSISYQGLLFDSAIFRYDVAAGLTEIVDNIMITQASPAVPEPSAGLVFGIGALLVGAACRRRSLAEVLRGGTYDRGRILSGLR
jgi:hypothetical protein